MICAIGVIQCSTVPLRASSSDEACCSKFMSVSSGPSGPYASTIRPPAHLGRSRSGTPATSIPYTEREHFHPVGLREWDRCPEGVCCSPDNGRIRCSAEDFFGADSVGKVGEEIAGAPAANAGAVHRCRSLQLERRLDALTPMPATQLQRYLTLTQHTRRQRAAVVLPALQGGAGSVR